MVFQNHIKHLAQVIFFQTGHEMYPYQWGTWNLQIKIPHSYKNMRTPSEIMGEG